MGSNNSREVSLEGEEHERVRRAESVVISSLNSMAGLVLNAMEGSTKRLGNVEGMTFLAGAGTLIVRTPEYCYVYDGGAGVCRSCTPEEEAGFG